MTKLIVLFATFTFSISCSFEVNITPIAHEGEKELPQETEKNDTTETVTVWREWPTGNASMFSTTLDKVRTTDVVVWPNKPCCFDESGNAIYNCVNCK